MGWSKTKSKCSFGIRFFQNRLNFGASYYNNLTENLLLDYTLAPSVGFRTMTTNVGAVKNEGIDLQLNGLIINDWERNIHGH
ncbi:MAG: TonB-dependent receptor domain-containing protein [Butyricimonas faecalis]